MTDEWEELSRRLDEMFDPPPAAPAGREDGGQRCLEDTSEAKLSDKYPAGRSQYSRQVNTSPASASVPRRRGAGAGLAQSIDVRVTPSQKAAIARRARALRVTPSVWARAVLVDALDARSDALSTVVHAAAQQPDADAAAAVEQLRRVGVLLNQTLKRGLVSDAAQLQSVTAAVDGLRAALGDRTSA